MRRILALKHFKDVFLLMHTLRDQSFALSFVTFSVATTKWVFGARRTCCKTWSGGRLRRCWLRSRLWRYWLRSWRIRIRLLRCCWTWCSSLDGGGWRGRRRGDRSIDNAYASVSRIDVVAERYRIHRDCQVDTSSFKVNKSVRLALF